MFDLMREMFSYAFMTRAILVGLIVPCARPCWA